MSYNVEKYVGNKFIGIVAGMGRNKNTWDSSFRSRRTAQRHAKKCRDDETNPDITYKVAETV